MVSLDSPLITLGALFIAGQDSRGRQFTGSESGKGLIAGGFAAGSAQYVVDKAREQTGFDSSAVSDELAQALVGAAVSRYGGMIPQNKAMGRGIMYSVSEQAFTKGGYTLGGLVNEMNDGDGSIIPDGNDSAIAPPSSSRNSGNDALVF